MFNDLVDPQDLSGFPGAPFADSVVDAAVASLRAFAGWHIAPSRTETLSLDCDGGTRVVLPSLHVTAVSEVRDTCSDTPSEIADYRWSRAGILSRYCGWPEGFQTLEVDLTHGHDFCPPELLASIAAACQASGVSALVSARSIGPFSETYREGSSSVFTGDAAAERYRLPPRP